MERLANAGAAETDSGDAAINKNAIKATDNNLIILFANGFKKITPFLF